jgi:hypothetical protein
MLVLKLPKTRLIRADYAIAGPALQLCRRCRAGDEAAEFAAMTLLPGW